MISLKISIRCPHFFTNLLHFPSFLYLSASEGIFADPISRGSLGEIFAIIAPIYISYNSYLNPLT